MTRRGEFHLYLRSRRDVFFWGKAPTTISNDETTGGSFSPSSNNGSSLHPPPPPFEMQIPKGRLENGERRSVCARLRAIEAGRRRTSDQEKKGGILSQHWRSVIGLLSCPPVSLSLSLPFLQRPEAQTQCPTPNNSRPAAVEAIFRRPLLLR